MTTRNRTCLIAAALVAFAPSPAPALEIQETDTAITAINAHYRATISRNEGGALTSLKTIAGQRTLLTAHRLYTDFGFYQERGYVGTGNETAPQTTVKREGDSVIVSSSGSLCGKPAEGNDALHYRLVYTFTDSPKIHVRCDITPVAPATALRAFLASCFSVPEMSE